MPCAFCLAMLDCSLPPIVLACLSPQFCAPVISTIYAVVIHSRSAIPTVHASHRATSLSQPSPSFSVPVKSVTGKPGSPAATRRAQAQASSEADFVMGHDNN
jgi:hypothetical protein